MNSTSTIKITILDEKGIQTELLQNQLLTIEFRDEWYISHSRHQWVGFNSIFLKLVTFEQITHDSFGKYHYDFVQEQIGKITIIVSINTQGYVWADYYNDTYLYYHFAFGTKLGLYALEKSYGYGPMYPNGPSDNSGAVLYFLLRGPVNGSWMLNLVGAIYATFFIGKFIF